VGIYFGAFLAGILSFVSPCILPLIPVYISFVTGHSLDDLKSGDVKYLYVFTRSTTFIIGFSLVFVSMGIASSALGTFLLTNKVILAKVSGIIVIFFGLYMMGILKLGFLSRTKRINLRIDSHGFISSFIFGVIFGFGWSPCVGPMLSSILIIAADTASMQKGAILLLLYSLGIGIPFLMSSFFINYFLKFTAFTKRLDIIEKFSGALLILAGAYLIYNGGF
jgi:cytochrome c-type biogenesis protein